MILGAVLHCSLTSRNGHQVINRTSRHYAEAECMSRLRSGGGHFIKMTNQD